MRICLLMWFINVWTSKKLSDYSIFIIGRITELDAENLITIKKILTMTVFSDHFTQFLPLKIITRIGLTIGCNITMTR